MDTTGTATYEYTWGGSEETNWSTTWETNWASTWEENWSVAYPKFYTTVTQSEGLGGGAYGGTLNNCVLWNNTAWRGGGADTATLNNCTVVENTSFKEGGGTRNCAAVNNSIIVYNHSNGTTDTGNPVNPTDYNSYNSTLNFSHVNSDPLFVDRANQNFRLYPDSPCVDAGNNSYATWEFDLDGNPRVWGSWVDMGAYECSLFVTPAYQSVGNNAGSFDVVVMANVTWSVSGNADWITVSPASGTGNGSFTISYAKNTLPSVRETIITVLGGSAANQTITVLQAAAPPPSGTVVAWGDNGFGQSTVPSGLSDVIAIAGGYAHSLALKSDGTVVAWGYNGYGQSTVPPGVSDVIAIAAGDSHSLALKSDGTVVAWGGNGFGQSTVPSGMSGVVAIMAASGHNLALKSDGTVVAWGETSYGQSTVPPGLSDVIAIAGGYYYSLALKSDGTVVAWGETSYRQSTVLPGLSDVIAIAGGFYDSLALKSDGTVMAWGENYFGESTVPPGLSDVIAIAAGNFHSLALKSDGTVVAWGRNEGQSTVPSGLSDVIAIAGGGSHNLSLFQTVGVHLMPRLLQMRHGAFPGTRTGSRFRQRQARGMVRSRFRAWKMPCHVRGSRSSRFREVGR